MKNINRKGIILPLFLIFAAIQRVNSDPVPVLVFPFDGAEPAANSSLAEKPAPEAGQAPSPEAAPGGKSSRVQEKQPVYSYISPEYIPQFPVYGTKNDLFKSRIRPVGAGLRFSTLPVNLPRGAIGFELSSFWNYLFVHYDLFISTGTVFNLVYQLPLGSRNFSFNFRGGGGVVSIIDLRFAYTDETSSRQVPGGISIMPLASGGVSFRALITKRFFTEIGAEFAHIFAADSPMGNIRAHLGVGWKLGGNSREPAH